MNCTAEIRAYGNPENLYKCFVSEAGEQNRSSYSLKKEKDCLVFEIKAEDSTSLRAILNSITKLLTVQEKLDKL